MRREELFIDILGGLDEKYVALAMPRSCGHDVPDDTRKTIPIKPVEVTNEVSRKESVIYWVTRSIGIAAAAFLIIGAAVLLIMNWDKIAVREPDRPGIVTTVSEPVVTNSSTTTEPEITVTTNATTTDEDPSTPNIDNFTATSADEWEKEQHRQAFYYPYFAINTIPDSLIALADPNELEKWKLMSVDITTAPPESIADYANICTFIAHFGIYPEDAKKALGEEYREYIGKMWQDSEAADRMLDIICSGNLDDNGNVGELINNTTLGFGGKLICPNWLYVHSLEDWKAAGVKAATINTMYDYYINNGVLSDEQTAEFKEKLDRYITENKQREESEYEYNDDGDVIPIEAPDAPFDDDVKPTDEEVQPTDDELKALVERGADACGLKVTVSDLTRGSLKLHYTRDKSVQYADKLAYDMSNRYEIQVRNSAGEWETYDPETLESWNDGTHWFDLILELGGEFGHEEEEEKILFYGKDMYETEIPNGHYRVKKGMAVYSEVTGERLGRLDAYAEFDITETTQNLFGIALSVKDVTPEGVTLVVWQDGHNYFEVKDKLGYKAWFIIEMKTGSGEWKKVDGNPVTWAPDVEPINENGVTEIKQDFSDIYGSLSDGTYRISMQFVNYGYTAGELTVVNCSTYYCEFVIGEKTHDWGITMSAKDVTSAGMTLVIDQKGGNVTGELEYGSEYHIEIQSDENGMWERLPYVTDEVAWTLDASIVDLGAHIEEQINWTYIYGYLPAGHYRLVKEFMDFRKTGDYDQCDFYMEFDVPEIDSKLGITLNTKRNTARWITLDAASIGDTVSGHMGFNESSYVIEQKKKGKWTEYFTTAKAGVPMPETARKINVGDVVTFTVDWRGGAGSLPVGEYRIGFIFNGGSVSETIYAEFAVEEYMTNEFGLQIRPIEISRTGGRFAFDSLGGDYNVRTFSDKEFSLQKQTAGGKWKTLPAAEGGVPSKSASPALNAFTGGGSSGIMGDIVWKELFGTLSVGHYRLAKKFSAVIDENTKEITLYCEFDITADAPEKIGE